MALVKPVIFQIVGFQNSGKTTLLKKLIGQLSQEGKKVVTIKHHGHGGKPSLDEKKDSAQHVAAGAVASLVEGDGRILIQGEMELSLEKQIQLVSLFEPDYIVIEGHKKKPYAKLVLIRNRADESLVQDLHNIKAVLYWGEKPSNLGAVSSFPIHNIQEIMKIINEI